MKGFCLTPEGEDQNDGVFQLGFDDVDTPEKEAECLNLCAMEQGATGCEGIWGADNRGCYVHTKPIG